MTVEEMFKKHRARVRAEWEEFIRARADAAVQRRRVQGDGAATGGNVEFKGAPAEAVEPKPAEPEPSWSADTSAHRYGRKVGFEWTGTNTRDKTKRGLAKTAEDAERLAKQAAGISVESVTVWEKTHEPA